MKLWQRPFNWSSYLPKWSLVLHFFSEKWFGVSSWKAWDTWLVYYRLLFCDCLERFYNLVWIRVKLNMMFWRLRFEGFLTENVFCSIKCLWPLSEWYMMFAGGQFLSRLQLLEEEEQRNKPVTLWLQGQQANYCARNALLLGKFCISLVL